MRSSWLVLLLLPLAAAAAEAPLRSFSWGKLKVEGGQQVGTVLPAKGAHGFEVLRIQNRTAAPRTYSVLTLDSSDLTSLRWQVVGKVRHENVRGPGYLELLNYFPGDQVFFTRTLAPAGPMRNLQGTSEWRDFVLPFDATEAHQPATKLVVNVVLPGRGVVELGPLELIEIETKPESSAADSTGR